MMTTHLTSKVSVISALAFFVTPLQAEPAKGFTLADLASEWSEAFTVVNSQSNRVSVTIVRGETEIILSDVTSLRDDGPILMIEMANGSKNKKAAVLAKDLVAITESEG